MAMLKVYPSWRVPVHVPPDTIALQVPSSRPKLNVADQSSTVPVEILVHFEFPMGFIR